MPIDADGVPDVTWQRIGALGLVLGGGVVFVGLEAGYTAGDLMRWLLWIGLIGLIGSERYGIRPGFVQPLAYSLLVSGAMLAAFPETTNADTPVILVILGIALLGTTHPAAGWVNRHVDPYVEAAGRRLGHGIAVLMTRRNDGS